MRKRRQPNWIRAKRFDEMYGTSIRAFHHKYKLSKWAIKRIDGVWYVNENYILDCKDFHKKIWNRSHENYYRIAEHITDVKFYTLLNKHLGGGEIGWRDFLRHTLFSYSANFESRSVINIEVPCRLWLFYRYTTWLIRILERSCNVSSL